MSAPTRAEVFGEVIELREQEDTIRRIVEDGDLSSSEALAAIEDVLAGEDAEGGEECGDEDDFGDEDPEDMDPDDIEDGG